MENRIKSLEAKYLINDEVDNFLLIYMNTENPTPEMESKYWKYIRSIMTLEDLVEGSRNIGEPDEHEKTG